MTSQEGATRMTEQACPICGHDLDRYAWGRPAEGTPVRVT